MVIYLIINHLKNKIMDWFKECSKLAGSINISDRKKAIQIFATNSILEQKKGSCDDCKWISKDKRSCYNPEIDNCNVFTNSLFTPKNRRVNVGDILGITYSDGNETVKIIAIENGNIIICKNFTFETITDNDIAIAVLSDNEKISKIKIKGVWLDYQVLN